MTSKLGMLHKGRAFAYWSAVQLLKQHQERKITLDQVRNELEARRREAVRRYRTLEGLEPQQ